MATHPYNATFDRAGQPARAARADSSRGSPWVWLLWSLAVAQPVATYVLSVAQHEPPLSFLTAYWDDFFYYLQIARNVATDFRSTFDGVNLTNGYHPLWLLILASLCVLFDPTRIEFHYALATLLCALHVLTVYAIFRYVRAAFQLAPGLALLAALVVQPFQAFYAHGMEITLAVPLILGFALAGKRFVDSPGPLRMLAWSGLGAICILARLDAAIVVALIGAIVVMHTPVEHIRSWITARVIAAFLLGTTPLVLCLSINAVMFGSIMPVSSQAKHLADFPVLSGSMLSNVFTEPMAHILGGNLARALVSPPVPVLVTFLGLLMWRRGKPDQAYWRAAHLAFLAFPFVHIGALFLLSDWVLWPWYYYSFIPGLASALAGMGLIATRYRRAGGTGVNVWRALAVGTTIGVALCAFTLAALFTKPHPVESRIEYGLAEASVAVAGFAAAHDGRFAMGDRGGRVGFLVPNRVLQLEGLVGSPAFLESIRSEADLHDVLRQHGVRYYVGTRMPTADGCHVAHEPKAKQAGEKSPRMTGLFCAEPVFRHVDHRGVATLIFDLAREASIQAQR